MKKWILSSVFTASTLLASATVDLHYGGEALVATGTGDFAPYYTSALRHGRLTQSTTLLGEVSAWVPMRLDRRFSWGACVDLVADYGSSVEYARYNPNGWSTHKEHPAPFWIQQAFAELKYRGVFLTVGSKEHAVKSAAHLRRSRRERKCAPYPGGTSRLRRFPEYTVHQRLGADSGRDRLGKDDRFRLVGRPLQQI